MGDLTKNSRNVTVIADPTEKLRRVMVAALNAKPGDRAELEDMWGQVWDTDQLTRDFQVVSFCAPFINAIQRATGKKCTLLFQHEPRFYFDLQESENAGA